VEIYDNVSSDGGGVFSQYNEQIKVPGNSLFVGNTLGNLGGAIFFGTSDSGSVPNLGYLFINVDSFTGSSLSGQTIFENNTANVARQFPIIMFQQTMNQVII
jgi:hypothetical protein